MLRQEEQIILKDIETGSRKDRPTKFDFMFQQEEQIILKDTEIGPTKEKGCRFLWVSIVLTILLLIWAHYQSSSTESVVDNER
jgi:hypothetical protein